MNFLVWYNPLTWLGDVKNEIVGAVVKAVRTMFYQFSVTIYKIVIYLYNTFETLCNARILNNDIIQQLATRIGLILGIIMLFMVSISFIQMLLEPDNVSDKEKGAVNVIKKVFVVIVMFGVSNFTFSALYQFQKAVINSNIISKFILPNSVDTDKFGGVLAAELFIAFYDVDPILKDSIDTSDNSVDLEEGGPEFCQYLVYGLKTNIANDYNFELGYYCLNEHTDVYMTNTPSSEKKQQIHIIDFNMLLCPIVGCICIWMLFSYCIMVGTRVIIISFLEIISPMAFISYLSPKKDTMFSKWLKLYTATYLDAFIRIAIINFVVFLIATIFTYAETSTFWNSVGNPDGFTKKFIMVLIVLSLLTFAKKAPDLLKDLFPNNSASKLGFGITSPKQMFDNMLFGNVVSWVPKAAAGVAGGALGGAAIGLLSGSPGGIFGGLLKGGLSGLKGQGFSKTASGAWKSNKESIKKMRDIRTNGGNWLGYQTAKIQKGLGMRTAGEDDKLRVDKITDYIKFKDEIEGYAKNSSRIKTLERTYEAIKQAGRLRGESDDHYTARIEAARQNWKRAMEATVSSSMAGHDIDYYEATIQRNIATGKWEVVNAATTSTITHRSIESGISSSISSKQQELNRVGGSLGYGNASDYATMDAINNQAKADVAKITSTEEYSRNKANNG